MADCLPPDGITPEVPENAPPVVTPPDPTDPEAVPEQPESEDWNFNYTVNSEDPTQKPNADNVPYELWELPDAGVPITFRGEPGREITAYFIGKWIKEKYPETDFTLTYHKYGANPIAHTAFASEDGLAFTHTDGAVYTTSVSDVFYRSQKIDGYNLVTGKYAGRDNRLLVIDDDLNLIAVHSFVPDLSGNRLPARAPYYSKGFGPSAAYIGDWSENPVNYGVSSSIVLDPDKDFATALGALSSIYDSRVAGGLTISFIQETFKWNFDATTRTVSQTTGVSTAEDADPANPGYYIFYKNDNGKGFDIKYGVSGNRRRVYASTLYFQLPADLTVDSTITVNYIYSDTWRWALHLYQNKQYPKAFMSQAAYQEELNLSSRSYRPGGEAGIKPSKSRLADFVPRSPSGNRVAVPAAAPRYPECVGIDRKHPLYHMDNQGAMILEKVGNNWEPVNFIPNPLMGWVNPFGGTSWGAINQFGQVTQYPSYKLTNWAPLVEFTDENTVTVTHYYPDPAELGTFIKHEFSIDIDATNMISGPSILSQTSTAGLPNPYNTVYPARASKALPVQLGSDQMQNDLLATRFQLGYAFQTDMHETYQLFDLTGQGLSSTILDDLPGEDAMLKESPHYKYNGFHIFSFPAAPLCPNPSAWYQAHSSKRPAVSRYAIDEGLRRGMLNLGYVRFVNDAGVEVFRLEPPEADLWAAFNEKNRTVGREMYYQVYPVTEVDAWATGTRVPHAWRGDYDPVRYGSETSWGYLYSAGRRIRFGRNVFMLGTKLYISAEAYKTDTPLDPTVSADTIPIVNRNATPADSDTLWKGVDCWYVVDLATIPELNP